MIPRQHLPSSGVKHAAPWLPVLLACAALLLGRASPLAAQEQPARVQRIVDRLQSGETHAYLLSDLQAGDRLTVSMRATSGDLDPAIGILQAGAPLAEAMTRYQADLQSLLASEGDTAKALQELRNRYFLAWDDDSGAGYAAALEQVVSTPGDYILIAGSALSALGRATSGGYEARIGLNADAGVAAPTGAPIAQQIPNPWGVAPAVEEITGALSAVEPVVRLNLAALETGQTFTAFAEAASGDLRPIITLRDFGGKALDAGNLGGQGSQATLQYTAPEAAQGYVLEVRAGARPDGTISAGDFRLLVGLDAPDVLTGQAQPQGAPVLEAPIEVQTGLRILRISAVNSQDENFTVLANLRMDWQDPTLAFSPDSCNCSVKLYSDKEVDRFLADVGSRWPAFTFFNQLGNRWIQSRAAAIWPDGRARYVENFNSTFQVDFDFRQYPFDTQTFPIFLDLLFPASKYTLTELPGFSMIDPEHGEDEFIISEFVVTPGTALPSAADEPVSRMTFAYSAPRHMNYYVLQVFLPILLIILISWFTFFLRDYGRRMEAAGANILLFIAFSWSLANNYPRLGYITFLDAIMAVTLTVNVLVLLYNVRMKKLESQGRAAQAERIDSVLDWIYPVLYLALIGIVVLLFF